jgi:hypothetical protein
MRHQAIGDVTRYFFDINANGEVTNRSDRCRNRQANDRTPDLDQDIGGHR